MRPARIPILIATLGSLLPGAPAGAASMVHRHGPDGIAHSYDDTLRVQAAVHNGAFFLSHNWVDAGKDAPDDGTSLFFVYVDDWTSREMPLFTDKESVRNRLGQWGDPKPFRNGKPTSWTDGNEMYLSGNAFGHKLTAAALAQSGYPSKDYPAVKFDPDWFEMSDVLKSFIEEIRLEGFHSEVGIVAGAYDMERGQESLCAQVDLLFGKIYVKLGGIAAFLAGEFVELGSDPINGPDDMPTEMKLLISGKIKEKMGTLSWAGDQLAGLFGADTLDEKIFREAYDAAKGDRPPSCSNIPGIQSGTDKCSDVQAILDEVTEPLDSYLTVNELGGSALVQFNVDKKVGIVPPGALTGRVAHWIDWKDPENDTSEFNEAAIDNLINPSDKLAVQMKVFERYRDPRPDFEPDDPLLYSGAYYFNSLYFYGPTERWFLDKGTSAGLVEYYVYARINRLNPYHASRKPGFALWERLDLITGEGKDRTPFEVPWPPPQKAWGYGQAVVIGDEGGAGIWREADRPGALSPPTRGSAFLVSVWPDAAPGAGDREGLLRLWGYAAFLAEGQRGRETPWNPIRGGELPLPPAYHQAGKSVRFFHATVTNSTPPADGYEYHWDVDGDGQFDSLRGHTSRNISKLADGENLAVCLVRDQVGNTGLGFRTFTK